MIKFRYFKISQFFVWFKNSVLPTFCKCLQSECDYRLIKLQNYKKMVMLSLR